MTPAEYDAWYDTPRGRWIGDTEFRLLQRLTALQPGETLLYEAQAVRQDYRCLIFLRTRRPA